jgi:hypothetical protein
LVTDFSPAAEERIDTRRDVAELGEEDDMDAWMVVAPGQKN